ncbi:MAG TPA: methyltransferase domain-containing protein [Caldilineaceae bacterium]|nr:methyltransferase domain-containing protein [Caldilineaceae bacterium]
MDQERRQWEEHYRTGPTPWDTRITPPEVVQFWQAHPPPPGGLALDLGCGTATNVAYLAGLGLRVVGFDLAGNALASGRHRLLAGDPQLLSRIQLVHADITCLPVRQAMACYILDIGCLHGIPFERRAAYVQGVVDNLAPGGFYQLFGFDLLPPEQRPAGKPPRGLAAGEVAERFAPALTVVDQLEGNPERQPCHWYLLQKTLF